MASPTTVPVTTVNLVGHGRSTGVATFAFCRSAVVNSTSGYVCAATSVSNGTGSAEVRAAIGTNATFTGISGVHTFWFTGVVNLAPGFVHLLLNCSTGRQASASAWIFISFEFIDLNIGGITHGISLLWWVSPTGCPPSGGIRSLNSPALNLSFNSTSYGSFSQTFNSRHTYSATISVGCRTSSTVLNASAPVSVQAGCGDPANPTASSFSLLALGLA